MSSCFCFFLLLKWLQYNFYFQFSANSPLYLSKSIRIRQIRVNRKDCHRRINRLFYPLVAPSCFVGGKNLMNDKICFPTQLETGYNTSILKSCQQKVDVNLGEAA